MRHAVNAVVKMGFSLDEGKRSVCHDTARRIDFHVFFPYFSGFEIVPVTIELEGSFVGSRDGHVHFGFREFYQFEYSDSFGFSLDGDIVEFANMKCIADLCAGLCRDDDVNAVFLPGGFETGSEIHGISEDGIVESGFRSDVSDHDFARGDSDAEFDRLDTVIHDVCIDDWQGSSHENGSFAGVVGMMRIVYRRTVESHDGIADIFVECSLILGENVRHA